ncbi:putative golgi complex component 7 (COG7) [Lyophyllum shimeji]|uniref:Conserved oligomeric Golgi complex subunit 7 n=1 Tax=Lyophyllum shimeji TaxID=47721 RepID=A0A9P3PLR1_LYOSH|nr:putative golgi complex component 7 (COG7) [Lyophyllum shimeji]
MPLPTSTTELISSLEQYGDTLSWINDVLDASDDDDEADSPAPTELTELDERITQLLTTLDIACEDTSSLLEHTIDDVSRGVPRLTYDLHFMKDNALSLQAALEKVLQRANDAVPDSTSVALDHLRHLDMIKGRMEATREALREAESWSSLELEVTSLLAERSYAKAAERLSEASRSMAVFHNTPEYEPRRTLMVNLQNQLEASLSSALVAAINSQDVAVCRDYFSIFCHIQRETEFRNYYNASRRASVVALWNDVSLTDCGPSESAPSAQPSQPFTDFLPKFYGSFLSLLNLERVSIPAIFPDPALTLSAFITSTLSSLQPTFSQRLSSLSSHHGEAALHQLISSLRATEEFAASVEKLIEKMSYTGISSVSDGQSPELSPPSNPRSHARRRSTRMSMSWRPGAHLSSAGHGGASKAFLLDGMEWDQELFRPFLDFQIDYGSLERRLLEHALNKIVSSDTKDRVADADRARLMKERAVDAVTVAEESLTRCTAFTYGYGSVGLLSALDNFFRSFIDIWTADVRLEKRISSSQSQRTASGHDLSDMDYTTQDWSDFQRSLHLLSSARAVYERISGFETKLRSSLVQTATRFRLARNDPTSFTTAPCRGESQVLEQSPLNSADLHALFTSVEADIQPRDGPLPSSRHSQLPVVPGSPDPLLVEARRAVFTFANSCQISLQGTILSPLRKHFASYASSPLWNTPGDPKSRRTTTNDLQVPSFSLSPSDAVQRVAEGLLNLPRLFEVYADDDALAFSLHTLPFVDSETLKGLSEQSSSEALPQPPHVRRASLSTTKPIPLDPDAVSSAWLSSLGHTLLEHLTTAVLPNIPSLSPAGAAQLASDLEYLSNIVRAVNVEFPELDRWKELVELDDNEGKRRLSEADEVDNVLRMVARLRSWEK